ncbi:MAG: hypothetical protein H6Q17_563 [Bacteroidetes bacterium]|nr:hypothetical protein [Bacteroidota bacterium]
MTTAPTLTELYTSISSDLKSQFGISSENDLKRVLAALASSDAGILKLFYLALIDVQKNVWPDQADSESMGGTLERFGRIKLGRDAYPATQGEYTVTFTGTSGTTLPVNTQVVNKSTNYYYTTTADVALSSTSGTASILSDEAGTDYALAVGDTLYLTNTITGIDSSVTVVSIITAPTDEEDTETYRALVLKSFRLEPNGGSAADYCYWALDVAGIAAVYPYSTKGASGSGTIYVEAEASYSSDGYGTPTQALLDALWKSSDKTGVFEQDPDTTLSTYERGRRQLGFTDINLLAVTPLPVVVNITNLKTQTTTVTTTITTQISEMLADKRPFIAGVGDVNNPQDILYFKDIVVALDDALEPGNTYDSVSVTVNGLAIPFQFLNGNIPYLSAINYV